MFGIFLCGALFIGAGIKAAYDNSVAMSKPSETLNNGVKVYRDRQSIRHINGEPVSEKYIYDEYHVRHNCLVGLKSGRVYYDYTSERQPIQIKITEENLEESKKRGWLIYDYKGHPKYPCGTTYVEISTGKVIAAIYGNEKTGVYRKFYADPYADPYGNYKKPQCYKDDLGVEITQEEYENMSRGWIVGHESFEIPMKIKKIIDPKKWNF